MSVQGTIWHVLVCTHSQFALLYNLLHSWYHPCDLHGCWYGRLQVQGGHEHT
jgi:hypothetical protein